ncbi:MAG TPA: hypothetical protein VLD58_05520 [Gemmatimonadales bacterium]|nr:hypothetical protein [Gemmatimonadales bacterium]
MSLLWQDIRYALRQFHRAPGLSLAVVATLAIGIAGNATVFSVVSGLLFRPFPFAHPERVISRYTSDFSSGPYGTSSYPGYRDLAARLTSLEGLAALKARPSARVGAG